MQAKITQQKWDPFVFQRLNDTISQASTDVTADVADRSYVVFDFDNTTILHDIEDHLMMYMLDHLAYKMTPEEFYQVLTNGPMNFQQPIFPNTHNMATFIDLADDIIAQYQVLYTDYIDVPEDERIPLAEIKDFAQYNEFAAKLRLYYQLAGHEFSRTPGENSPIYWFKGYTTQEFSALSIKVFEDALNKPLTLRRLFSSQHIKSKVGKVESTFEQGIRVPEEILQLWSVLRENNIDIYVISASPIDLVRTVASQAPFNLPKDQIFGMCYDVTDDGIIDSRIEAGTLITKGLGKVEVIKEFLERKYQKEPLMLFGDSMGDYPMMTQLPYVKLSVLFNRYAADNTQQLVLKAINSYRQDNSKLVLQGRDENKGTLRPSMSTIPLGHLEPVLQAEEVYL